MPFFDFVCDNCECTWDEMTKYDTTGEWAGIKCPECGSEEKEQIISPVSIGHTASKMDSFSYRAGYNMDKAKTERRNAEAIAGGDTTPYRDTTISDISTMGEGIHDPKTRPGLSKS
jgi:putative FmdB family regulatory protein